MLRARQRPFLFRHFHGGTGCRSAHKPFLASSASCSNPSSTISHAHESPYLRGATLPESSPLGPSTIQGSFRTLLGKWFHFLCGGRYGPCPASKNVRPLLTQEFLLRNVPRSTISSLCHSFTPVRPRAPRERLMVVLTRTVGGTIHHESSKALLA